MPKILGKLESQLLSYAQMRRKSVFRSGEIAELLSLSSKQSNELLSRLCRKNVIARVNRGLYLVPTKIPPGGVWTPSEFLALETLMTSLNATWQITGKAAFQRYGWEEQISNRLDVYNDRVSGQRKIGTTVFRLIKVFPERLGATEIAKLRNGEKAIYSSKARALVDSVYDWKKFGSLPRAFGWIKNEASDSRFVSSLVKATIGFGNTGTMRRIGATLSSEKVSDYQVRKLRKALGKSSSLIPLDPTKPKRGKADSKWGVVLNG